MEEMIRYGAARSTQAEGSGIGIDNRDALGEMRHAVKRDYHTHSVASNFTGVCCTCR